MVFPSGAVPNQFCPLGFWIRMARNIIKEQGCSIKVNKNTQILQWFKIQCICKQAYMNYSSGRSGSSDNAVVLQLLPVRGLHSRSTNRHICFSRGFTTDTLHDATLLFYLFIWTRDQHRELSPKWLSWFPGQELNPCCSNESTGPCCSTIRELCLIR